MEQPITITCSPVNQRWTPHDYLETAQLPWNKRGFGPNPSSFTIHKLRAVLDDLGIPYLTTDTTKKLKALLDVWRQGALRALVSPSLQQRTVAHVLTLSPSPECRQQRDAPQEEAAEEVASHDEPVDRSSFRLVVGLVRPSRRHCRWPTRLAARQQRES